VTFVKVLQVVITNTFCFYLIYQTGLSGRGSEEKNSLPLPGIESPVIKPVA
jgi:hypothetical protein